MPGARANYGLDAPPVVRNLFVVGLACIAAGVGLRSLLDASQPVIAVILLVWGAAAGLSMLVTTLLMIYSSRVGKLKVRERMIDSLALRGDESVLDVGCGRGLLLNSAARRLTSGKAFGIDLWQSVDQSGNSADATRANAQSEGVADRIVLLTGDMRSLPFADAAFDVVVSSLAVHNVPDEAGRTQAVSEIARVLKPGGRLRLLDFRYVEAYAQTLRGLGWRQVEVSPPVYRMFPPPRIVRAEKPS